MCIVVCVCFTAKSTFGGQKLKAQTVRKASVRAVPARSAVAVSNDTAVSSSSVEDQRMDNVLSIILGGGAGTRLYPLTKTRAKPAVPLGANYRLIDIPVSNCINSDINKVYCLTQFNSASLNRHLSQAYNSNIGTYTRQGFVEVLAAQQSPINKAWFQGTADAVRQYLWLFAESGCEDYLILSGDHLYRMDYKPFVTKHRESLADITVAALPTDEERASSFGLMKIDASGRIIEFSEKPQGEALKAMQVDTTVLGLDAQKAKEMPYIASMGIYVFTAKAMQMLLMNDFPQANDFGGEVIPQAAAKGLKVQAYLFEGYWEDIGTVDAFFHANLECNDPNPKFSFYDRTAPIYTQSRFLPPSKILDSMIERSTIGDGCMVKKSKLHNCMVGLRSLINEGCDLQDALIMGADYYEKEQECSLLPGCTPIGIGAGTVIRKAIIDKNARIGMDCVIDNKDNIADLNAEDKGYIIRDGIIVVIKDAVIPAGSIIPGPQEVAAAAATAGKK
jgi:glucose-1-phosphate adenylyltransferase|eukprot:CAMPEP_0179610264 /NCGR_PEP_ID=MMETSP0930-20121108/3405_1 /TAXON_ID=548131 ORGANISM="Ostreococcus mediterraneus, Strain clade-D-RCC1621" /NCGR_SAMPLE_ID=MMETSP0930 /ASSEMBLY_ACC=CAM_ASM_000580 /LENGTH=503 /DNA_ID=CAMNT_0021478835 /DNA_START=387 /DNA_END=1898 /DNA_ORIENTATION=+